MPSSAANLRDRVADERFPARVAAIAEKVAAANDQQTVHALFQQGVAALGATSAVFVSFVRDDGDLAACRFMLACDPHWARLYVQEGHFAHDPWLAYAAHHSEPVVASTLNVLDGDHQRVIQLAARAGFVSALLVPAHSGAGHSRISLLCLGSASPGYFEDAGLPRLRVSARMLALELHDWWLSRIRRDLIAKARITAADLILLQHECQGHGSKKIATELQVSTSSINSRFQRMNAKLGAKRGIADGIGLGPMGHAVDIENILEQAGQAAYFQHTLRIGGVGVCENQFSARQCLYAGTQFRRREQQR